MSCQLGSSATCATASDSVHGIQCRTLNVSAAACDVAAAVQVCSHEQLLILVHEGGLINKLRGMLPQRSRRACMSPSMLVNGPGLTINMLTALWTDKVHELSKQLNKRLQGVQRAHVACKWGWPVLHPGCQSLNAAIASSSLVGSVVCTERVLSDAAHARVVA